VYFSFLTSGKRPYFTKNLILEGKMKLNNKWSLIEQIDYLHESIEDECQEYLYYLPHANRCIYERINNASTFLLHNALRIFRNQKPLIKTNKAFLTIENTKELMLKIYQTMLTTDFPIQKENQIKNIMREEFMLNPEDLLRTTPTTEQEYYKNLSLLNGKC